MFKRISLLLFWIIIWSFGPPYLTIILPAGDETHQEWLDEVIIYLQNIQTDDIELRNNIDYTITNYNKIGPWDVAIRHCWTHNPRKIILGMNVPWCPGLTITPYTVEDMSIKEGAVTLFHESLHDTHFGHDYIDTQQTKLYRTIRNEPRN